MRVRCRDCGKFVSVDEESITFCSCGNELDHISDIKGNATGV